MTEFSTPQMTLTALQGLAINVGETVLPALLQAAKKPQASLTPNEFARERQFPARRRPSASLMINTMTRMTRKEDTTSTTQSRRYPKTVECCYTWKTEA